MSSMTMARTRSSRLLWLATLLLALGLLLASPASAATRYRDQVFNQVTKKTDIVYGVAPDENGQPREAEARPLPAEGRHGAEAAGGDLGPWRRLLGR